MSNINHVYRCLQDQGQGLFFYNKGKEVIRCFFCIRAGKIHLRFVKKGVGLMTAILGSWRVMVLRLPHLYLSRMMHWIPEKSLSTETEGNEDVKMTQKGTGRFPRGQSAASKQYYSQAKPPQTSAVRVGMESGVLTLVLGRSFAFGSSSNPWHVIWGLIYPHQNQLLTLVSYYPTREFSKHTVHWHML